MRRLVLLALAVALLAAVAPSASAAEPCPPYDGAFPFPMIQGPEGPEEYCWEVTLNEDQELRQVDEHHVGVYRASNEVQAWQIDAPAARDAMGASVPTTIAVSGENLITITVHHRNGNPAAGGAPFHYPVSQGPSYETGFATVVVNMPPPTVQPPPPTATSEAPAYCVVPSLQGKSRRAAARELRLANCGLGPVRGENSRGAKVVKQYQPAGKQLPEGSVVGVKLG